MFEELKVAKAELQKLKDQKQELIDDSSRHLKNLKIFNIDEIDEEIEYEA